MGTSTSSALGIQLPLAMTNEVDSAPVSVCTGAEPLKSARVKSDGKKKKTTVSVSSHTNLWEKSKVLHYAGTFLVEYSDSQKGHASAQILEGQMEASAFGQWPETPNFCVDLH